MPAPTAAAGEQGRVLVAMRLIRIANGGARAADGGAGERSRNDSYDNVLNSTARRPCPPSARRRRMGVSPGRPAPLYACRLRADDTAATLMIDQRDAWDDTCSGNGNALGTSRLTSHR
ncbi:hypothetical protein EVAR_38622_1 [Eumeta japonica]|uniref:Uncharacterized protein n=1 Tax=Eumeta variegata TaxID=151549 RepID=A0A4C1WQI9_EUMVA|nr:hypothetical protein EVAR_38622_1 [Eumeta japonica]